MKKGRNLQEKSMHQETTQKCWGRGTSSNWPHTGPAISLWWREQSCKMNKNNETWGRRTEPRWWKPRKTFDLFYRFRTLKTLKRRRHQIFHCTVMTYHSERNNAHARENGRLCTVDWSALSLPIQWFHLCEMDQNVIKTCLSTAEAEKNKFVKIRYHTAFSTLRFQEK